MVNEKADGEEEIAAIGINALVSILQTEKSVARDLAESALQSIGEIRQAQSAASLSAVPVATKKTYLKPFRTIVEIETRWADRVRDFMNASPVSEASREALKWIAKQNEAEGARVADLALVAKNALSPSSDNSGSGT